MLPCPLAFTPSTRSVIVLYDMSALGPRIRSLRESLGWSLTDLAARTGFDPANLSRMERGEGNPRLSTLERLAGALGCRVDLAQPARQTLATVTQRAERGRQRLAAAATASPSPWQRIAWKAARGDDVAIEAAALALAGE
jgi:transcriptional regulator with XRE-family HTH domain